MHDIVALNQASFILGGQSIDNIVIWKEIIHNLWYTNARRGGMVLKLDLEKAYDRTE